MIRAPIRRVVAVVLVTLAALTVSVGGPADAAQRRNRGRRRVNEAAAQTALHVIYQAQQAFRASAIADVDGDGVGEFGTLRELAGVVPVRRSADGSARFDDPRVVEPMVPALFGGLDLESQACNAGYYFKVFLPDADGRAVKERQFRPSVAGTVDTDRAETTWCAYAWPVRYGRTGRWTYFVNQDGVVTGTEDRSYSGSLRLFDSRRPVRSPIPDTHNAGAAFSTHPAEWGDDRRIDRQLALDEYGVDGNRWLGLRDATTPVDPGALPLRPGAGPRRRNTVRANEEAAVATLRRILAAQEMFREMAIADVDRDGVGEYGMLRELTGAVAVREESDGFAPSGNVIDPPLIPLELGHLNANAEAWRDGYVFKMFLPQEDHGSGAPATEETQLHDSLRGYVDSDTAERIWCCYAWPIRHGRTGRWTFAVNQTGFITGTNAPEYSGTGDIDEANAGEAFPDEYYSRADGISGPLAVGQRGVDGNVWLPIDVPRE